MNITLKVENEFIPVSHNNKNKHNNDQVKIIWRYPTPAERNLFREQYVDDKDILRMRVNYDKILETCIVKIKNLSVNGEKIDTGKKLNNTPGLTAIAEEVGVEILSKMNEVNSKNF